MFIRFSCCALDVRVCVRFSHVAVTHVGACSQPRVEQFALCDQSRVFTKGGDSRNQCNDATKSASLNRQIFAP